MDKITLTGMQFFARHGVMSEEAALGQRFVVDMEMGLDLSPAGKGDNLRATVNYAEVYATTQKVVEGNSYRLIEAVAEEIAAEVKKAHPLIQEIKVTVHKPGAPIPGIFEDVAVTLQR